MLVNMLEDRQLVKSIAAADRIAMILPPGGVKGEQNFRVYG
jgi:hypothetical protein